MKEYLDIYKQNKENIENYLKQTIVKLGNIKRYSKHEYKDLFSIFPSLELVYVVNQKSNMQISPNYYKNKTDEKEKDQPREYLLSRFYEKDNENITFTTPYYSIATKNTCVTLCIKENEDIIFLDFNLESLLERLSLIELNKKFHTITKIFYTAAGVSMFALAAFIVIYSIYEFVHSFLIKGIFDLDTVFKPIIALTLSVAIFDLAKTIMEQEVYFKSYSRKTTVETKMIIKFLISIIIALSIEALMVVFKITLKDYSQMVNALYLISGASLFIISLSIFIFLTKKKESQQEEHI